MDAYRADSLKFYPVIPVKAGISRGMSPNFHPVIPAKAGIHRGMS